MAAAPAGCDTAVLSHQYAFSCWAESISCALPMARSRSSSASFRGAFAVDFLVHRFSTTVRATDANRIVGLRGSSLVKLLDRRFLNVIFRPATMITAAVADAAIAPMSTS